MTTHTIRIHRINARKVRIELDAHYANILLSPTIAAELAAALSAAGSNRNTAPIILKWDPLLDDKDCP